MNRNVKINPNHEKGDVSQKGSVLFKKESYNPSPLESKVGISPHYDVVDKHLIEKPQYENSDKHLIQKPHHDGVDKHLVEKERKHVAKKSLAWIKDDYESDSRIRTPNSRNSEDLLSTCPTSTIPVSKKVSEALQEASDMLLESSSVIPGSDTTDTQPIDNDPMLDKFLEPTVQEVVQSAFVRLACQRLQHHLELFNVEDPLEYDLFGKTYEEVRDFTKLPEEDVAEFEAGYWEPPDFQPDEIFDMEPQEKLITRFHIFQKALLNMAEHFETMRPLLAEIKQSYEEVFEKCEKDWKDLDKERMEKLKLKEAYAAYVRETDKEGSRSGMEVKVQAHALQEHVQWQQHTLFSILGMLWKMRQSLKTQTRLVKKTKVVYKSKVETLARDIVSQQGQSMYESALPEKYTEIMERFKQIKDPKEVRRMLQSARRQLRKAHKQLVIFEADYADTVPRTEFEMYKEKYTTIQNKNKSVIQKCDELKAEIEKRKANIAKLRSQMYEDVGLDEITGEKPIVYVEPVGVDEGQEEEEEESSEEMLDDLQYGTT